MGLSSFLGLSAQTGFETINGTQAQTYYGQKDVVFLDVRTAGEVAGGRIKGAQHIDVTSGDFAAKARQLDQSKTYVVYCRSGARSSAAAKQMAGMGFEKLYNLSGGIGSWNGPMSR